MTKTYTAEVLGPDSTGEYYLDLSPLLQELNWECGDTLLWTLAADQSIILQNLTKNPAHD